MESVWTLYWDPVSQSQKKQRFWQYIFGMIPKDRRKEATEVGLYQTKKLDVVKQIMQKGTCEKGETVKEVPSQRGLASKSQGTLISRCHEHFSSHRLHVQQGSRVFVSLRRTE